MVYSFHVYEIFSPKKELEIIINLLCFHQGGESAVSPGHSSDYAEQEELVTVHSSVSS